MSEVNKPKTRVVIPLEDPNLKEVFQLKEK